MKKIQISFKWFIPILVAALFLTTSLTSFAATQQVNNLVAPTNIGVGSCTHTDYLLIRYSGGNVCYSGDGYAGAHLVNVSAIDPGNNCGWVLMYTSGSAKGQYIPFSSWLDQIFILKVGSSNLITQITIQGQGCTGVAP